jgi:hypothetical protein
MTGTSSRSQALPRAEVTKETTPTEGDRPGPLGGRWGTGVGWRRPPLDDQPAILRCLCKIEHRIALAEYFPILPSQGRCRV